MNLEDLTLRKGLLDMKENSCGMSDQLTQTSKTELIKLPNVAQWYNSNVPIFWNFQNIKNLIQNSSKTNLNLISM